MASGKTDEACPKFKKSHELSGALLPLIYLGDCESKAGRHASALAIYRDALKRAEDAGNSKLATLVKVRITVTEPLAGSTAAVPAPGAPAAPAAAVPAPGSPSLSTTGAPSGQLATAPASAPPPPPRPLKPLPPGVEPLTKVGDAEWKAGVGMVRPGEPPPDAAGDTPQVPPLVGTDLNKFLIGLKFPLGYTDVIDQFSLGLALEIGHQWRQTTSTFAPWFAFEGGILASPSDPGGFVAPSFGGVVGLDWHPWRRGWVAFGPFFGYRVLHTTLEGADGATHGPEWLGARVKIRSEEAPASPPVVEADFRIALRTDDGGTLPYFTHEVLITPPGIKLFVEYRLGDLQPATTLAETKPFQVRWGLGVEFL